MTPEEIFRGPQCRLNIREQDAFLRQEMELRRLEAMRGLGIGGLGMGGLDPSFGRGLLPPPLPSFQPPAPPPCPEKPSFSKSLLKFGHITLEEFNAKHGIKRADEVRKEVNGR
jgi:hypothetical protein